MSRPKKKKERQFTEDIDRLLVGKEVKVDEKRDDDYRSNISFAEKLIECRGGPSLVFQDSLKRRLLLKLAEKEEAEAAKRERISFWSWLRNLFSQSQTWRLTAVQIAVAAMTLALIWGTGPLINQEPILTGPIGGISILEPLFFILGLVNNAFLILIFLIRRNRPNLLRRIGWSYFLLAIPAIYGIFLAVQGQKPVQFIIFLGIFLVYLVFEWLYDFALKVKYKDWGREWKLVMPYLFLYYAMNFGFIVMPWKTSLAWGITILCLFIIQIIANLWTHQSGSKPVKQVSL